MGSTICMNVSCGAKSTHEWKKGWPLRSGGHAILCYTCGSAYEKYVFCDTFHLEESGWRECNMCNKRLHCGCIASKLSIEFLDTGGVGCTSCTKRSTIHLNNGIPNGFDQLKIHNAGDLHSSPSESIMANSSIDGGKLAQLCRLMEAEEANRFSQSDRAETNTSVEKVKQDEVAYSKEVDRGFLNGLAMVSSKFPKLDNVKSMLDMRDVNQSLAQPPSTTSFGASLGSTSFMPFPIEGKEKSKATSPFNQGQKSRLILPKPSKSGLTGSSDANKTVVPELRIARPPGEGRGKSQLLPRYWPRITDQELQKLSGDLNSNIVPLFEKILSASDAGRIGRLVLPKACAEAYFPAISQSEGIPINVQDIKGREWTFQFRFWPNNNSRMYVLEGVTPCIQSMQLQAGDTITFSRIDPGGKLVIGFRKATNNSTDAQDDKKSAPPNGTASGEASFSDYGWNKGENNIGRVNGAIQQQNGSTEKKRTRTIGLKSKRLLMNSEDAVELRVTWGEAQDLLRPAPSAKPSIVTIEDHEFEEYEEPPVFGKRTLFMTKPFGEQEQWAQCDNCSKWRKLPVDALLPPKWTCSENMWDVNRSTCSSPEEISLKELDSVLKVGKDFKKRRLIENHRVSQECEPSGLDALASAAVLGDEIGEIGEQSVGATTKHPRHRPGCSCIVCIQPPSGKGKHKPTCTCNVCMTVKRRFKTLMLRKKKRQSEREAETSLKDNNDVKGEVTSLKEESNNEALHVNSLDNKESQSRKQNDPAQTSTGQFDLNCHPNREDMQLDITELNMINLADAAGVPAATDDTKPNGHGRLISKDWPSVRPSLNSESEMGGESLRRLSEEAFLASLRWDQEGRGDS